MNENCSSSYKHVQCKLLTASFDIVVFTGTPEMDSEFHHDYVISPAHSSPNLLQWKYKPSSTVWLKTSPAPTSTHGTTHDVFQHYFATVSQDRKHWLAKKVKFHIEISMIEKEKFWRYMYCSQEQQCQEESY
jgi:hypothetical protein